VEKSLSITSNIIQAFFGKEKAVVGVVHCPPLPGSPKNRDIDFESTLQSALDDAHVKHGAHAITADRSIAVLARDVEFFDADAVIAIGQYTGDAASIDDIRARIEARR
jgi:predicted TIM-barrel enzyme